MKKSLFLLAALLLAITASAQLKFGVKAGLNVTDIKFDTEYAKNIYKNKTGFFIGPTVRFNIPLVGLSLDAAALYDQREAEADVIILNDNLTETKAANIKRQAINIPVNLRYGISLGSALQIFAKAGPQFGFNIGDKEITDEVQDWRWKSSEFSLNLGFGITLVKSLEIAANYNMVLGETSEVKNVISAATEAYKGNKNNAWQVSAAFYF